MSRVGNNPIEIPSGVTVEVKDAAVKVKGPKGELSLELDAGIAAKIDDGKVVISRDSEEKHQKSIHGTMRSLIANMIEGVNKGFSKELEIQGVGFKAQMQGRKLVMALGFSHPIEYEIPEEVNVEVPEPTKIIVTSTNKHMVGQVSARIRDYFPAEPYKGKGVRYKGEHVRRKAGKTVA